MIALRIKMEFGFTFEPIYVGLCIGLHCAIESNFAILCSIVLFGLFHCQHWENYSNSRKITYKYKYQKNILVTKLSFKNV
jgi:hypothetical protein